MNNNQRFFGSDNSATVHPAVMEAMASANRGHAISYGDDDWTREAVRTLQKTFGRRSSVAFVYNGTGANVLGIQSALSSYHAVICTDISHINTDECGAPERFTGAKLLAVPSHDGKLNPDSIGPLLEALGTEHHSQPKVVSLTQATELGTVYQPEAIREIAGICHKNDLLLHMDGARISNAAVTLGKDLGEITTKLGVDILSLGGTKNGMMFGEAIILGKPELAHAMPFIRKQGMQLASKMRYIAAQFQAMFGEDLWRENAAHANTMARLLSQELKKMTDVEVVYPVEANAVFAKLPPHAIEPAQREVFFYPWDAAEGVVRLMCSYDTTEEDIRRLVHAIDKAIG